MKNQTVIVTGGAGFVGSAVVHELNRSGARAVVIDNLSVGSRAYADVPDDRFFQVDIRDTPRVSEIFATVQPGAVIHLAAVHFIPFCNERPLEAASINLLGTRSLLSAARTSKSIAHMLFASTAAVYPILDGPINESQEPDPIDIYGVTKLFGEHLMHEYWLETEVRTTICRLFNVFGPNETNPHLIPEIHQQLDAGHRTLRLGNLKPRRDFVHSTDVASAFCGLLDRESEPYRVYNVGTGVSYSAEDVVSSFSEALGEAIVIESEPARRRSQERMDLTADAIRLRAELGWAPQYNLQNGIRHLLGTSRR